MRPEDERRAEVQLRLEQVARRFTAKRALLALVITVLVGGIAFSQGAIVDQGILESVSNGAVLFGPLLVLVAPGGWPPATVIMCCVAAYGLILVSLCTSRWVLFIPGLLWILIGVPLYAVTVV